MKHTLHSMVFLVLFAGLLAGCGDVGDAPKAETNEAVEVEKTTGAVYTIDTSASSITWKAAKVTDEHDGGFKIFNGTVQVADGQVTSVAVNVDATSVWSDTEKLTGHLKTDDFFAVETYPEAKFEASKFTPADTAGATHMVTGNLTMRGKTNSITFPATIQVNDNSVTARADFIIDRQRWGIVYAGAPDNLIKDEVRIMFDITANKQDVVASAQ